MWCHITQGGKRSAKEKRLLKKAGTGAAPEPESENAAADSTLGGWRSLSETVLRRLEGFTVRFEGQPDEAEAAAAREAEARERGRGAAELPLGG